MGSPLTAMEKTMICAVKLIHTVENIWWRMAVNDVEQDDESQFMSRVDQFLQFVQISISTAYKPARLDSNDVILKFTDNKILEIIDKTLIRLWKQYI